jgi:hypothetical protein
MTLRFLLDENLAPALVSGLRREAPALVIWRVGEPLVPPLGTPDPEILRWCEAHDCVLITNNRRSMPGHLRDHLTVGHHVPGILLIDSPDR